MKSKVARRFPPIPGREREGGKERDGREREGESGEGRGERGEGRGERGKTRMTRVAEETRGDEIGSFGNS